MNHNNMVILTEGLLHAAGTSGCGFCRKQLAVFQIPWPPPNGWLKDLIGKEVTAQAYQDFVDFKRVSNRQPRSPRLPRIPQVRWDVEASANTFTLADALLFLRTPKSPHRKWAAEHRIPFPLPKKWREKLIEVVEKKILRTKY